MKRFEALLRVLLMCVWLAPLTAQADLEQAWIKALGIPELADPWQINTRIEGVRVNLTLPADLPKVALLPEPVRRLIEQRIRFREKNLRILRDSVMRTARLIEHRGLRQKADYQHKLWHVVISIFPEAQSSTAPLARHEPILKALPDYSSVQVYVPDALSNTVIRDLETMRLAGRTEIHRVPVWSAMENGERITHVNTRWARDLLWVLEDNEGESYVVTSLSHGQTTDLARPDNTFLTELDDTVTLMLKAPLFFRSGNLLLSEKAGKRVLFVGSAEIDNNRRDFYNAFFFFPPPEGLLRLLKDMTGADEVVVVPNSKNLFHLDMAVAFIGDGVAAVLRPLDASLLGYQDVEVLEQLRNHLRQRGFQIVDVPTVPERIAAFQSPVNLVSYTDARDDKRYALLPEFPDREVQVAGQPVSLNRLVREALSPHIRLVPIEDRFHPVHGNTHCALMVLR